MAACLEHAIAATARRVGVAPAQLATLPDYRRHGTYLGQLALALGAWRLAGGDDRHEPLHAGLCRVLAAALADASGGPIASFPTYSWPFDTIPALLALRLRDVQQGGTTADAAIAAHLAWIARDGTDPATGLPWSVVTPSRQPPRGCELSWRVALLAQLDRAAARALWTRYRAAFWQDGIPAGLREWPRGVERGADADSGPIVGGLGMSASGLGLGAALAVGDADTASLLVAQIALIDLDRRPLAAALRTLALTDDPRHRTGFLFGDVCLLYAATWSDWGTAR